MRSALPDELAKVDRGRWASSPAQIPALGWKDVFWRIYQEMTESQALMVAAAVTYYMLLSFVPMLTAILSVYGYFFGASTASDQIAALRGIVPGGGLTLIEEQVTRLSSGDGSAFGITFVLGLLLGIWSASAATVSLFEAMNVAYGEAEERGLLKLYSAALVFIVIGFLLILMLMALVLLTSQILNAVHLDPHIRFFFRGGAFVLMMALVLCGVSGLYRWGPCRARAKWIWVMPGAILVVSITFIISVIFSWYVASVASYDVYYGSIGALIGFMSWAYISIAIIIVGAELNAEMEHQTMIDTTVGPDRPMGQRGAYVADTIGETIESRRAGGERPMGRGRRRHLEQGRHLEPGEHFEEGRRTAGPISALKRARRPGKLSWGAVALAIPAATVFAAITRSSRLRRLLGRKKQR